MIRSRLLAVLPAAFLHAAPALAHPGHSGDPDHGLLHAIGGLEHLLPMALAVIAAILVSAAIRKVNR